MEEEITKLGKEPPEREDRERVWDWQRKRDELDRLKALEVLIASPQRNILSSSLEALGQVQLPGDLSRVTIGAGRYASSAGYSAEVTVDLERPNSSQYSIVGRDAQIVNGVTKTLEDRLEEHHISHRFAHQERYHLALAWFFALPIAWAIFRLLGIVRGQSISLNDMLTGTMLLSVMITLLIWGPTSMLLEWLFPYFTYAEDRRNWNRRVLKGVILFVAGSVFVSLLYDLIRQFLLH
jgi:hypothetical protein